MKWKSLLIVGSSLALVVVSSVAMSQSDRPFRLAAAQTLPDARAALQEDYRPVMGKLARTELPLRLPSYLPGYSAEGNWQGDKIYYAHIGKVTPHSYVLYLDLAEVCGGATVCSAYELRAEVVRESSSPLTEIEAEWRELRLTPDIRGVFIPSRCTVNCSQAKIIFDLNGVRYTVAGKAGIPENLVKIANSMIENPIGRDYVQD